MMAILADTDVALLSTVSLAILIVALIGIAIEIAVLWFRRSSLLQTPPASMSQTQPPTLSPAGMPSSAPAPSTRGSVGISSNVEFERLEPDDLKQVTVVAQALDNQWVPRDVLARMLKQGQSLEQIGKERLPIAS
jgi:hypothetical protein